MRFQKINFTKNGRIHERENIEYHGQSKLIEFHPRDDSQERRSHWIKIDYGEGK